MRHTSTEGAQPIGRIAGEFAQLLTPEALHFLATLQRTFGPTRNTLLAKREARQLLLDRGVLPTFLPETRHIRHGDWKIAPVPTDLQRRRAEITGPASGIKMVINAFNSGADAYMTDAEDSEAPTFHNLLHGQHNLRQATRRQLELKTSEKTYTLNDTVATLLFRPPGWHLLQKHI